MKKNVMKNNSLIMLGLTFFVLLSSYALEYFFNLTPCPLCIMQRFCTVVLAFLCLLYFVLPREWKRTGFWMMQFIFILIGIISAGRQLWLQLFATHDSSLCMPGFEELIHYFSWDVILKMMFWGSNDCATVSWTLMGLPMSVWSMGYFILMLLLWIRQIFFSVKQKS
jgi:disulfide bond formation protein DsbB